MVLDHLLRLVGEIPHEVGDHEGEKDGVVVRTLLEKGAEILLDGEDVGGIEDDVDRHSPASGPSPGSRHRRGCRLSGLWPHRGSLHPVRRPPRSGAAPFPQRGACHRTGCPHVPDPPEAHSPISWKPPFWRYRINPRLSYAMEFNHPPGGPTIIEQPNFSQGLVVISMSSTNRVGERTLTEEVPDSESVKGLNGI